jgi:hypothetical protein
MPIASANPYPSVLIVEGAAPASPAATQHRLYVDTADKLLKWKDSGGVVRLATGQPLGLTGAVSATRYVGGTASVAPTTGTFAVGDFVITATGGIYVCTAAGSPGTWVAVSGAGSAGALVLLEQHAAANSASLDFTTFISSTYDNYLFEGVSLILQTSTADLRIEAGTGGGPTWDTGNYYEWSCIGQTSGGIASNDNGSTGVARIFKSISVTAAYGFGCFSFTGYDLQSTTLRRTFHGTVQYVNSAPAAVYGMWGMQYTQAGTALSGIRFIPSTGNIVSGTIRVYGIAK